MQLSTSYPQIVLQRKKLSATTMETRS